MTLAVPIKVSVSGPLTGEMPSVNALQNITIKSKTKGLRPRVQKTETNSNSKEVTVNHRVVTEAVTNSNKVTSRDTTLDMVDMVPRAVITSKVTVHTTNSKVTIPINNKDNNKVTIPINNKDNNKV